MPRTEKQLREAAEAAERWLNEMDPADPSVRVQLVEDTQDLRDLARLVIARAEVETAITKAVAEARGRGRTWTQIATMLGVSKQSALEHYGKPRWR